MGHVGLGLGWDGILGLGGVRMSPFLHLSLSLPLSLSPSLCIYTYTYIYISEVRGSEFAFRQAPP